MWTGSAISNAKWKGCRLRVSLQFLELIFLTFVKDVLIAVGVNSNTPHIKHVQFEGADTDASGQQIWMLAQIPIPLFLFKKK